MTELEEAIMKKDEEAEVPAPEAVGIAEAAEAPAEPDIPEMTDAERETEPPELSEEDAAEIVDIIEGTDKPRITEITETPEELLEYEELPEYGELPAEDAAPETLIRESSDAVRRMTEEIQQENERLDINFAKARAGAETNAARLGRSRRRYVYIGTFSAALSLIVMGTAICASLFSPEGVIGAFKLAPLMLVFLGVEILFAVITNRSARIKFSVKSLILTFSLLALTFALSLISVSNSVTGGERAHAGERLHNILAREVSRVLPSGNIKNVDIDLKLYADDPAVYRDISDIRDSDLVSIGISYANVQESVFEFAADCRAVMDRLKSLDCGIDSVSFAADDGGSRYSLNLNWLYQSELSAVELIPLVGYYGEDVSFDIPDLGEDTDED